MNKTSRIWLLLFVLITIPLVIYFYVKLSAPDKTVFMPGEVSFAHNQIELECAQCHDAAFSGNDAIEKRCRDCHQETLLAMHDAHGNKKFSDPRNADWLSILDARQCLSCHQEHVPERTSAMALTQPRDFCSACHADVADERESHRDLKPDSCLNSGCHNYHDASTLHEAFLNTQLAVDDKTRPHKRLPRVITKKKAMTPDRENAESRIDAEQWQTIVKDWQHSAHAMTKGNCSDCHRNSTDWSVPTDACQQCHEETVTQFGQGRHGMRAALGLAAMTIAQAQMSMDLTHGDKTLQCHSCHNAHDYNTKRAEAEACLGCHNDEHSLAWQQSKHAQLWQQDSERGASCATCHMPRHKSENDDSIVVQHNQSANLRPSDKMLKTVCLNCHGIDMSMAALADREQIKFNFHQPASAHQSLDWVRQRQLKNTEGKTP